MTSHIWNWTLSIAAVSILASCEVDMTPEDSPVKITVSASVETEQVASLEDAADDPAIWVNPTTPGESLIIGTDKKRGLDVYKLDGSRLHSYEFGKVNNVDLRPHFPLNDSTEIILVAGSNRSHNSVGVWSLDSQTGALTDISARPLVSETDEVYGFCLHQHPVDSQFYAFVVSKTGKIEQWHLFANEAGKVDGKIVRQFSLATQGEGMVADDQTGTLYVAEEDAALWKFDSAPTGDTTASQIITVAHEMLQDDLEGVTLFKGKDGQGYLIVSSQGNHSYAIFDRQAPHAYIGSFRIDGGEIDGTQDTDGIDVTSAPLGEAFPNGVFIAQDGNNTDADGVKAQNFKLVPWEAIAASIEGVEASL
ncbi:phytase [Pontibacter sp. G13]|uniref:phytase n=1 Tax=Pontibacter sp. G13 TaxID=3074898 RepID=UPI002888F9F3|nr:phytase [Pontibacter sp. G13]WNJ17298.1 phytase [Pontibacter sp. G13]